jgi:ABC-type polysaccharide/polyol phosphate export permease
VKTIEAISGLANATMVPMWIVSGVFFSSQRFPDLVQPLIKALPLTAVIDALRANMLQGAGFAQMAPQAAVLGAWLAVCFGLALKLFRWR